MHSLALRTVHPLIALQHRLMSSGVTKSERSCIHIIAQAHCVEYDCVMMRCKECLLVAAAESTLVTLLYLQGVRAYSVHSQCVLSLCAAMTV
jgi:hypothetical protein